MCRNSLHDSFKLLKYLLNLTHIDNLKIKKTMYHDKINIQKITIEILMAYSTL